MPYDPAMVAPMRAELSSAGVEELLNAGAVDHFIEKSKDGTALIVVNSVCGCAAGGARPGVTMALRNETKPDHIGTVFAGQDVDATQRARDAFGDIPPSSPCIAIFKQGELIHFVPRHMIEGRDAKTIAWDLVSVFDEHCAKTE